MIMTRARICMPLKYQKMHFWPKNSEQFSQKLSLKMVLLKYFKHNSNILFLFKEKKL